MEHREMPLLWARIAQVAQGAFLLALTGCTLQAAAPAMGADEAVYWRTQAALLDPAAYRFLAHTTARVPDGATWQAVNLWRARDSSGEPVVYQREADVRQAIALPARTRLDVRDGFAYVATDATDDPRYASGESAKALYYRRLQRLRTLPLRTLSIRFSGAEMGRMASAQFPPEVTRGLVVGASAMDVAWVALQGRVEGVNLFPEISDDHEARNAHGLLLPFETATFPGIMSRPASVSGSLEQPSLPATASVVYVALPEDW